MLSSRVIGVVALLAARSVAEDAPKPLEVPPSQYFEGNDGPWSTFDIRVGTGPDPFLRVLPSTAAPYAIVALSDVACSPDVWGGTAPSTCAVSRGKLFDNKASPTWMDIGLYGINADGVGLEGNLGYEQRVEFGLDQLGLGLNGPKFANQTIAGIATPEPFYLGVLGLNNQPTNFSTLSNYSAPAVITALKDQKKIPSVSWSYTAGAHYRENTVYGQLIFSGYDTSRFKENPVSFTMAGDITRDLVVSLQSISYSGKNSASLLSSAIEIYIDSTDPNLWLPADVVTAFETAFGLTLDPATGLYLVNESHHFDLLNEDAQVTFRLSDVNSGGDSVPIVLPYRAFDLQAGPPLAPANSSYFPLKRAANATQYTLGRTFLQEAYLSADYERKVFNVSACVWNSGAESNIVAIRSLDADSSNGNGPKSKNGLGKGAIAGIVVGSLLAVLAIAAAIAYLILRKRRKWINKGFNVAKVDPVEPDEAILKGPVFNSASPSTAYNTTPESAAALMTAPTRSTAEHTRNNSATDGSTPAQSVVGDHIVHGELDGRDTLLRPNTELDGREIHPIAENPGVYELPGTEVADDSNPREAGRVNPSPSAVGSSPSNAGNHTPPSPFTSTWDGDRPESEMVSPTTPRHHSRF